MPAVVSILVTTITEALAVGYDQIKVYRSATETGTYTEISTASTRVSLVAGTTFYQFVDLTGDSSFFYQTSFYRSSDGVESSRSAAGNAADEGALDIITIDEVKQYYLFGLDLTDDAGNPFPDSSYVHWIRSAVSMLETRLDIHISPRVITDEVQDYIKEDFDSYIKIDTDHIPVQSVSGARVVLPAQQTILDFDASWIHLTLKEAGQINIIPGGGAAGLISLGLSAAWFPVLRNLNNFLPGAIRVDYVTGFAPGEVPPVLKDTVGKIASFGPLNIAGDLLGGAGIASQSLSLDGLSQSFNTTSSATNAGYGARLLQYKKELDAIIPVLRKAYHPVGMVVG